MSKPLDGAVVWEARNSLELILRTQDGRYVRVCPAGDGENGNFLIYDWVIEVANGVWATVPDVWED